MSVTVIILTFNEAKHIERAILSVKDVVNQICIVDSGSSDNTIEIATRLGAEIYEHAFVNQAKQFQWALDTLPITGDWILRLDADEILEQSLIDEIKKKLHRLSADVVGIQFRRKHVFMDRWVKHGGRYPLWLLRLWRKGHGRVEDRWMDEHVLVSGGRTITFEGSFVDHNLNDLTYFIDKHNKYATREALEIINQRTNFMPRDNELNFENSSWQAALKRTIKLGVFNRLPFEIGSLLYFLWRYIFQMGFLDGRSGLIYHFLQGFWYRFLVGSKVQELTNAIRHLNTTSEIRATLSTLTGHKF